MKREQYKKAQRFSYDLLDTLACMRKLKAEAQERGKTEIAANLLRAVEELHRAYADDLGDLHRMGDQLSKDQVSEVHSELLEEEWQAKAS